MKVLLVYEWNSIIQKNYYWFHTWFHVAKTSSIDFLISRVLIKMLTDNRIPCYFNFNCDIKIKCQRLSKKKLIELFFWRNAKLWKRLLWWRWLVSRNNDIHAIGVFPHTIQYTWFAFIHNGQLSFFFFISLTRVELDIF